MNHVPVIVWNNPEEGVVPVDPAVFISGNSQIITAQTSEDEDTVEEVAEDHVDEHDDVDMPPALKDVYDLLGELSEKIQTFDKEISNPGQPTAVPNDTATSDDEDDVGEVPEDAEEDIVLQGAIQSLSSLNDGLRSVLSLSRDTSSSQPTDVPRVDVWDTEKVIEQEIKVFPDPDQDGVEGTAG